MGRRAIRYHRSDIINRRQVFPAVSLFEYQPTIIAIRQFPISLPPCLPLPIVYPVISTFPGSAGFDVQNFLAATPVWPMASAATMAFILRDSQGQLALSLSLQ